MNLKRANIHHDTGTRKLTLPQVMDVYCVRFPFARRTQRTVYTHIVKKNQSWMRILLYMRPLSSLLLCFFHRFQCTHVTCNVKKNTCEKTGVMFHINTTCILVIQGQTRTSTAEVFLGKIIMLAAKDYRQV